MLGRLGQLLDATDQGHSSRTTGVGSDDIGPRADTSHTSGTVRGGRISVYADGMASSSESSVCRRVSSRV